MVKYNDYIIMQVSSSMKTSLQKGREERMGKINEEMRNFRMVLSALVLAWYLHGFKK